MVGLRYNGDHGLFHFVPYNDVLPHYLKVSFTDIATHHFECHCNAQLVYNKEMKENVVQHQSFDLREMCAGSPLLFPVITKIEWRGQKERIVAK